MRRKQEEGQRRPGVRVPTFSTEESTSVCDLAVVAGSGRSRRSWLGSSGARDTRAQTGRARVTNQALLWCLWTAAAFPRVADSAVAPRVV